MDAHDNDAAGGAAEAARQRREQLREQARQRAVRQVQDREAREKGRQHNRDGRDFHTGMALERGETAERGWQREYSVPTTPELGTRRLDQARPGPGGRGLEFTEYKSGRSLRGQDTRNQLAKDRWILEHDRTARGTWVIRQGARVSATIKQELTQLQRDFPGRFTVVRVSAAQRRRAVTLGREALSRQLEIPTLERDRMLARQREADRAAQARTVQDQAARTVADTKYQQLQRQQNAARDRAAKDRAAREAREERDRTGREAHETRQARTRQEQQTRDRVNSLRREMPRLSPEVAHLLAISNAESAARAIERAGVPPDTVRGYEREAPALGRARGRERH